LTYLDDILEFRKTLEEYYERFKRVFERIERQNLSLNALNGCTGCRWIIPHSLHLKALCLAHEGHIRIHSILSQRLYPLHEAMWNMFIGKTAVYFCSIVSVLNSSSIVDCRCRFYWTFTSYDFLFQLHAGIHRHVLRNKCIQRTEVCR
jgi:hypothetical protein